MDISDKLFVITGAARGLGAAMSREILEHGGKVALVDLDLEQTQATRLELDPEGSRSQAFAADVSNEADVENLFVEIESALGPISGVVNNAGILDDGLLLKVENGEITSKKTLAQWQRVINVNLTGVFLCGREAAACMVKSKTAGVIINISSISRAGNRGQSNYAAAKAGVEALTVTWSQELARFGIRVNALAPGVFSTEMVDQMPVKARNALEGMIPLSRVGDPKELAHSLRFLIENDYCTGRMFEIDGGLRL